MHTHNQSEADGGDQGIEFTWDALLCTGREGGLAGEGPLNSFQGLKLELVNFHLLRAGSAYKGDARCTTHESVLKCFSLESPNKEEKNRAAGDLLGGHGESPTELLLNEKQKNSSNSHYALRSVLSTTTKVSCSFRKANCTSPPFSSRKKKSLCFSVSWFSLGFQSIGHTIIIVILFCLMIDPSTFIK